MNAIEKLQYDFGQWYETSSISQFMHWWTSELKSFVPEKYKETIFSQSIDVFIVPVEGKIELWSKKGNEVTLHNNSESDLETENNQWWHKLQKIINEADGRQINVQYLLSDEDVLVRKVAFPQAAKENLDEVIGFELDKYVPFKADQVHLSYKIDKEKSNEDNVLLDLAVIPKQKLEHVIKQCEEKSVELNGLDVNLSKNNHEPQRLGVNLLPHENRKPKNYFNLKLNLLLMVLVFALIYFVMYTSLSIKQEKVERLTDINTKLQKQARQSKLLKKELKEVIVSSKFLQTTKAQNPVLVSILSELTAYLPEHTYISRFKIGQDAFEITGFSGNANSLVPLLNKSEKWYEPRIVGAISPDARTQKEKFTIKADLKEPQQEDEDVNNG